MSGTTVLNPSTFFKHSFIEFRRRKLPFVQLSRKHGAPPSVRQQSCSHPFKTWPTFRKTWDQLFNRQSHFLATASSSSIPADAADDPKSWWVIHPDLDPHIRSGLASSIDVNDELLQRDTGFLVSLLGTGSGAPSLLRGNSATALRMGSTTYLFDAGEGVQLQLMKSRIRKGDIHKIFITHLHGDHVFGLCGLLLAMQVLAKETAKTTDSQERLLQIYGPEGLYNYISIVISLSHSELKWMRVEVYELQGTASHKVHRGGARVFPEFRHRGLIRKTIPRNDNGTWTLETPQEFTSPNQLLEWRSGRPRGVYVTAAEVHHLPKLSCFGYLVKEPLTQPCKIDVDRACAAGVRPGFKYNALKFGFPVTSDDDESKQVTPEQVLVGEPLPSHSVAILGDCCAVPDPMADLCRDVDVLIHEATLCEQDSGSKLFGGHSTAAMAGSFAARVNAKVLLLNHISPSFCFPGSERALAREAESQIVSGGRTRVQVGYDHLELLVPRTGFPW